MNLSLPQLVIGVTGALLIYAAVKNVSPVQVVKDALNGQASKAADPPAVMGPIVPQAPFNQGAPSYPAPTFPAPTFGAPNFGALYSEGGVPNSGIPVTSGTPNKVLSV